MWTSKRWRHVFPFHMIACMHLATLFNSSYHVQQGKRALTGVPGQWFRLLPTGFVGVVICKFTYPVPLGGQVGGRTKWDSGTHMRNTSCESTGPFVHALYRLQVDKRQQWDEWPQSAILIQIRIWVSVLKTAATLGGVNFISELPSTSQLYLFLLLLSLSLFSLRFPTKPNILALPASQRETDSKRKSLHSKRAHEECRTEAPCNEIKGKMLLCVQLITVLSTWEKPKQTRALFWEGKG